MEKMNNDQLLELLKTNVEGFNQYRKENPEQEINFSFKPTDKFSIYKVDLYKANLRGANLSCVFFEDADFRYADLRGADFKGANLYSSNFYMADLREADLRDANFSHSDFVTYKTANMKISEWQKDMFIESFLLEVKQ